MNRLDILFLIITSFAAFCMCLSVSCKRDSTSNRSHQSGEIFNVDGCGIYYAEVIHDNHEYLISNHGGMMHKVNCEFCKK